MTLSQEKMRKGPQPRYSRSTKKAAVQRAEAGERIALIAAEVGCPVGRIYYWLEQWRSHGGAWPERPWRRRLGQLARPGSTDREEELERLLGQKQAELDFLREALRLIEQAGRPIAGRGAPSPSSSSRAGRLVRKAG